jgi:hypothetical protein
MDETVSWFKVDVDPVGLHEVRASIQARSIVGGVGVAGDCMRLKRTRMDRHSEVDPENKLPLICHTWLKEESSRRASSGPDESSFVLNRIRFYSNLKNIQKEDLSFFSRLHINILMGDDEIIKVLLYPMESTSNINGLSLKPLTTPYNLLAALPIDKAITSRIINGRETIIKILSGQDPRLLVVVGPCSFIMSKPRWNMLSISRI